MANNDELKASISNTLNEVCMAQYHFASTQGLDMRDDTFHECLEIIARLERKMLAKQSKPKKRK